MSIPEQALSFVHVPSQRTGYITKALRGPNQLNEPVSAYGCVWDDTGGVGEVPLSEIEFISIFKRHITDGVRTCHCGPSTVDGVVRHKAPQEFVNAN